MEVFQRIHNVDYERIEIDFEYKKKQILQLARTANEKELSDTIELAVGSGLLESEVLRAHFEWIWDDKHDYMTISTLISRLRPSLIMDWKDYEPSLQNCYAKVCNRENQVMFLFYNLLLEMDGTVEERRLFTNLDRDQINLRRKIIQDLQQFAIERKVSLKEIGKEPRTLGSFMTYWNMLEEEISIRDFIACLKDWEALKPLRFFANDDSNFLPFPSTLHNPIARLIIEEYYKDTNWPALPQKSKIGALNNILDVLPLLDPGSATTIMEDLLNGKWKSQFKPSIKITVLEKATSLGIVIDNLDFMKSHLNFLNLIQNSFDELGRPIITPALLNSFDIAKGSQEKLKDTLIEMALDGFPFNVLKTLVESLFDFYTVKFEPSDIYKSAIEMALKSEKDIKMLQIMLDALKMFEVPPQMERELDFDGWGFDDDFDIDSPEQLRPPTVPEHENLVATIISNFKLKIEDILLNDNQIVAAKKLRLLNFYEKALVIN